ncbi:ribbon-helix-helix domain-containing protein [Tistrella sp.]|nr:hypothetical protein [Tistrella sp.]|tara:strand:+ start:1274 stop:1594 length:321 start_codon:yes stop_codon:yes gene_type:complete
MANTRRLEVNLPADVAAAMDKEIDTGRYGSADDFLEASARALLAWDEDVERWLHDDVPRAWQEYLDNPDQAVSSEDLLDVIHADYLARLKAAECTATSIPRMHDAS